MGTVVRALSARVNQQGYEGNRHAPLVVATQNGHIAVVRRKGSERYADATHQAANVKTPSVGACVGIEVVRCLAMWLKCNRSPDRQDMDDIHGSNVSLAPTLHHEELH